MNLLARALWWGTKQTAAAAGVAGVGAAAGAAYVGTAVAAETARLGLAAGYVGYHGLKGLGKGVMWMGGGKAPIEWTPLGGGSGPAIWPQFNRAVQNTIGWGALGLGVAAGVAGAVRSSQWDLNRAIATNTLEVEQPHFMGATGSLALSLHKNRNKAKLQRMGYNEQLERQNMYNQALMYADDAMRLLL